MIIPDVNVLVFAHNPDAVQYRPCRNWWEQSMNNAPVVGLPWLSIIGFIRICTQRRIMRNPIQPGQAVNYVRGWLQRPNVEIVAPGPDHPEIFFRLLSELGTAGNLTTDAHLAALAIEYRAELASTDADFARFRGLRWFNPLEVR